MKGNIPLKRHQALVSFSKDHHFGLLLVWKIRQGISAGVSNERISNYVLYFFTEDLAGHFQDEEQLLFCELPAEDSLRKRAENEHESIYKLVEAIAKNKNDTSLLNQLANELEQHIRFEERELFNHLQNNLEAERFISIAERLAHNSKAIDDSWDDVFWQIKK